MGKVVVLGVFVADTTYRSDRMPRIGETLMGHHFFLSPGGKGSNQAVAAARMGADVTFISKLGNDPFSEMAFKLWDESGVTPRVEQIADNYTGAAFVFVEHGTGDNAIIISPGAASTMCAADIEKYIDVIGSSSVFLAQLEQPVEAAFRSLQVARAADVTTILNPAPASSLPAGMLDLCDYFTPNQTEAEEITGIGVNSIEDAERASAILREMGVGTTIITLGETGVFLDGYGLIPAVVSGTVVDTTGAGDAFNGAFAAAIASGDDLKNAVKFGCTAAGISVTRHGAARSMPTFAEVNEMMQISKEVD